MESYRKFNECPKCRKVCQWRHGLHFDHEMICYSCYETFNPNELWFEEQEERDHYNTHRD